MYSNIWERHQGNEELQDMFKERREAKMARNSGLLILEVCADSKMCLGKATDNFWQTH